MESEFHTSANTEVAPKVQRRNRERLQRRALLLEAAEKVFGQKPFDEASVQEVAAVAGIGMQGLYEHFPSKQALYEALVLQRGRAYQERVEASLAGLKDPLDQIRAIAGSRVALVREHPAFFAVFLRERIQWEWHLTSRFAGRFFELYESERLRLRGALVRAVKQRKLRRLDPDLLVILYTECLQASLLYMHRHRPEEKMERCVERAMGCFLQGAGARE